MASLGTSGGGRAGNRAGSGVMGGGGGGSGDGGGDRRGDKRPLVPGEGWIQKNPSKKKKKRPLVLSAIETPGRRQNETLGLANQSNPAGGTADARPFLGVNQTGMNGSVEHVQSAMERSINVVMASRPNQSIGVQATWRLVPMNYQARRGEEDAAAGPPQSGPWARNTLPFEEMFAEMGSQVEEAGRQHPDVQWNIQVVWRFVPQPPP